MGIAGQIHRQTIPWRQAPKRRRRLAVVMALVVVSPVTVIGCAAVAKWFGSYESMSTVEAQNILVDKSASTDLREFAQGRGFVDAKAFVRAEGTVLEGDDESLKEKARIFLEKLEREIQAAKAKGAEAR